MRYHALACDYDGTIAHHGTVDEATIEALQKVRESGRKVLLVTGRELDDLVKVFPRLDIFDRIVAENGALLYRPATREEKPLAEAPPRQFAETLSARGAERVSVGRVIVATWEPHEKLALDVIHEMQLELQVIFNKGAVMVLPSGVNKAFGLTHALAELSLSPHNVVGVGDAENDHAFMASCECSVAVANALDMIKQRADWVTAGDHSNGVRELIQELLASDLRSLQDRLHRKFILGQDVDGHDVIVKPYGTNILVIGTSGGGKSTLATAFMEQLAAQKYQFVIIDPEGDYSNFEHAVVLGDNQRPPSVTEVLDVISKADQSAVVNLIGLDIQERPKFFATVLPRMQELRAKTGRPHWLVIDEGHHVLPESWEAAGLTMSQQMYGLAIITLDAKRVKASILGTVDLVIAVGDTPEQMLDEFADSVNAPRPRTTHNESLTKGEAVAWFWRNSADPIWFRSPMPASERRRHRRKYAEGELQPDQSFYFRGPEGKLNLRAQNLNIFLQMADGVDEETWLYHLQNGDVATWFRNVIKDPELAAEAEHLEDDETITAESSRAAIRRQIEERYILARDLAPPRLQK
jgi:HAD superfamily hydrolase (TIGR01484 family)